MSAVPGLPPTFYSEVQPHTAKTVGFVVSLGGDACKAIQHQETRGRKLNRDFRSIDASELARHKFPASWFVGILWCPGHTLEPAMGWLGQLSQSDLRRVRLYVHTGVAVADPFDLQYDQDVNTWERFHQLFGLHHALQAHSDHVLLDSTPSREGS